jgi:hypothetical protein
MKTWVPFCSSDFIDPVTSDLDTALSRIVRQVTCDNPPPLERKEPPL